MESLKSGQLVYLPYSGQHERRNEIGSVTPEFEAQELAADARYIAALAVRSEIEAAQTVGMPVVLDLPDPSIQVELLYAKGDSSSWYSATSAPQRSRFIRHIKHGLDTTRNSLHIATHTGKAMTAQDFTVMRTASGHGSRQMVFDDASVPPYIQSLKDQAAEAAGLERDTYSWNDWFRYASDESLMNYAQWYTSILRRLSIPEQRAKHEAALKDTFASHVDRAVHAGWIDERHVETLARKLANTHIRFYSAFGKVPETLAGEQVRLHNNQHMVLLPVTAGEYLATHELGHIFAATRLVNVIEYLQSRSSKTINMYAAHKLHTILSEGFNEHLAVSLLSGQPELISPYYRKGQNIPEPHGTSSLYVHMRDVLHYLVHGKNGEVAFDVAAMKDLVDVMVDGDFLQIAQYFASIWGGRDIVSELYEVILRHNQTLANPDTPMSQSKDHSVLSMKLSVFLQAALFAAKKSS